MTAIAEGLRALHRLPAGSVPRTWTRDAWFRTVPPSFSPPPPVTDPVVVHGDACAPNTLLDDEGRWRAHVDVGALGVGDRWADLAVAAMSLPWNYDPARADELEALLYASYGVEPDVERIAWYRAVWDVAS